MVTSNLRLPSLTVKTIHVHAGHDIFSIPVSQFPAPKQETETILAFLSAVIDELRTRKKFAAEVFIKVSECRHDGAGAQLAEHGREWQPRLGLGVWPDRPTPTRWTKDELENLAPGERPRNMMDTVLYLGGEPKAKDEAWRSMLGVGALIIVLTTAPSAAFLNKTKQVLQPMLVSRPFKSFPLYVPLFDSKSFRAATLEQLSLWFCGAGVYIRESPEDSAIIISSTHSLTDVFEALGGKIDHEQNHIWKFGY